MTVVTAPTAEESVHAGWLATARIDPLVMRIFVWSGFALMGGIAVGFGWLMHMIPPPGPGLTKAELLQRMQDQHTSFLIGAAVLTFFFSFWVTWAAPIMIYIRRMERVPVLSLAAVANIGGGQALITLIALAWTTMAYRADDAATVQAFNDFGWFLFLYSWPPFAIFMLILALAIFRDSGPTPPYPRWVAYYNIFAAMGMAPASLIGLFKSGPFAYNGLIAFWFVAIEFFVWMTIMSVMTFKAISSDQQRSTDVHLA